MNCHKHTEGSSCIVCTIEESTEAIINKLDETDTVIHTGKKVDKLNMKDLGMMKRRMWHECGTWTKIKRIIAGLITLPVLLLCFMVLYTFRLVCNLMVYAGGGYWKWNWKF